MADGSGCIAHHPRCVEGSFKTKYLSGCSGHDEPELFPISNARGSARDLTWTVVLPTDGGNGSHLLVRRHGHRSDQPLRPGVRRAPVLSGCAGDELHATGRLRRLVLTEHVHRVLAGLETDADHGTIVLSSKADGPLMPAYDVQAIGNSLAWGLVDDAPNRTVRARQHLLRDDPEIGPGRHSGRRACARLRW